MKFRKTIAMLLAVSMLFTGNGFTALALEPDDHAVGSSQVQDSGFVSNEEMVNGDDFSDSGTAESDGWRAQSLPGRLPECCRHPH